MFFFMMGQRVKSKTPHFAKTPFAWYYKKSSLVLLFKFFYFKKKSKVMNILLCAWRSLDLCVEI